MNISESLSFFSYGGRIPDTDPPIKKEENNLTSSLLPNTTSFSELDTLECLLLKEKKDQKEENYKNSYLRNGISGSCTLSKLKRLFSPTKEDDSFADFKSFLDTHRRYAHEKIEERELLLKKGRESFNSWKEGKDSAKKINEAVHKLKAGEQYLYMGSYGLPKEPLKTLSSVLNLLPESVRKEIPKPIEKFLKQGNIENLATLLEKEVMSLSQGKINSLSTSLDLSSIHWLFPDLSRQAPNILAENLPSSVTAHLESWIQDGLINSILEFVPDGKLRNLLLTLSENIPLLKDKEYCNSIAKNLVEGFSSFLKESLSNTTNTINDSIQKEVKTFFDSFPEALQEIFGISSGGQFWIDFHKEENGTYTLLIYSSGTFLKHHPKDEKGAIQWPLRITNIASEKLDTDFFDRLNSFHFDPQKNEQLCVDTNLLYKNLLGYLEGTIDTSDKKEGKVFPSHILSREEMEKTFLLNPTERLDLVYFEMRLEALRQFCLPYLDKRTKRLTITDETLCPLLEKAISQIIKDAKALSPSCIGEYRLKKILATCSEIEEAIIQCRKDNPKKESYTNLWTTLRYSLQKEGLSLERLKSAKEALCWALGDDEHDKTIGTFIDMLTAGYEEVPKVNLDKKNSITINLSFLNVKARSPGFLRTILFSAYFTVVVKVIQAYLTVSHLSKYALPYFLANDLLPLLQEFIPEPLQEEVRKKLAATASYIPSPIKAGFHQLQEELSLFLHTLGNAFAELRQALIWLIIKIAFKYLISSEGARSLGPIFFNTHQKVKDSLFPPDDMRILKGHIEEGQQVIRGIVKKALGTAEVSFVVPTNQIVKAPLNPIILSFPKQAILIKDTKNNKFSICKDLLTTNPFKVAEEINEKNLLSTLKSWLAVTARNEDVFVGSVIEFDVITPFLLNALNTLHIPQIDKTDYWDTVKKPELILESLSDLSIRLVRNRPDLEKNLSSGFIQGPIVVTLFCLLSMMHKLALRCPNTHLDGYQLNTYYVLQWLKCYNPIVDAFLMERLKQASAYLMPDIDLDNLPSDDELKEKAKKALFDYSSFSIGEGSFFAKFINDFGNLFRKKVLHTQFIDLKKISELRYLSERLQNPLVNLTIEENHVLKDPFYLLEISALRPSYVSERDKLSFLLGVSSNFVGETKHLLPLPYKLLRYQTLLLNTQLGRKNFKTIFSKNDFRWIGPICPRSPLFGSIGDTIGSFEMYLEKDDEDIFTPPTLEFKTFQGMGEDTQTDVIRFQSSHKWYMVPVVEEDQIMRLMGYYRTHRDKLCRDDTLDNLYQGFFHKDDLINQLKECPQTGNAIGIFLTESLDYLLKKGHNYAYLDLVWLSIKLRRYCSKYVPESMSYFPDVHKRLDDLDVSGPQGLVCKKILLQALAFDRPFHSLETAEEKEAFCLAMFRALLYPTTPTTEQGEDITGWLERELMMKFWEERSSIFKAMEEESFRENVLTSLLTSFGITTSEEPWKRVDEDSLKFCKGSLEIDLDERQLKGMPWFDVDIIKKIEAEIVKHLKIYDTSSLKMVREGEFSLKSSNLKITVLKDQLLFCREEEGEVFRYQSTLDKSLLIKNGVTLNEEDTVWIEDTKSTVKEVRIYTENTHTHTLIIEATSETSSFPLKQLKNESLEYVDSSLVSHTLAPLTQFCRLNQIRCWKNPNKDHLAFIEFMPYNLSFTIKSDEEGWHAVSKLFPSYEIAKRQADSRITVPCYLLLENRETNHKKVIIPVHEWSVHTMWKGLNYLGPLGSIVKALIPSSSLFELSKTSQKSYSYDLEEDGTLISQDPQALCYILNLYLIQGEGKKAEKVCTKLELIGHQKPLPNTFKKDILPIAIAGLFSLFTDIPPISRRLILLLRENSAIYSQISDKATKLKKKKEKKEDTFFIEDLILGFATLWELKEHQKEEDPRKQMTENEEWSLFQELFSSSDRLFALFDFFESKKKNEKKLVSFAILNRMREELEGSSNLFEIIGMPYRLDQRYRSLNHRLNKKTSSVVSFLQFARNVITTPSDIPDLSLSFSRKINTLLDNSFSYSSLLHDIIPLIRYIRRSSLNPFTILPIAKIKEKMHSKSLEIRLENISLYLKDETDLLFCFPSFYEIAKGEQGAEKQKHLIKMLYLFQESGNTPSSLLIDYLLMVTRYPWAFSSSEALLNALDEEPNTKENNVEERYPLLKNFFFRLFTQTHYFRIIEDVLSLAKVHGKSFVLQQIVSTLGNKIFSKVDIPESFSLLVNTIQSPSQALKKAIPLLSNVAIPPYVMPLLHFGSKVYKAYHMTEVDSIPTLHHNKILTVESNNDDFYQSLSEEDVAFDDLFDSLFSIAFTKISPTEEQLAKQKPIWFLNIQEDENTLETSEMDPVNQSIWEFQTAENQQKPYIHLKSLEALWTLHLALIGCRDEWRRRLHKERKQLLNVVNSKIFDKNVSPITFEELFYLFVDDELEKLHSLMDIPLESILLLSQAIKRHLVRWTRAIQQIERALRLTTKIGEELNKGNECDEKIEELAEVLRAIRAYFFTKTSKPRIRYFLAAEFMRGILLWPSQVWHFKTVEEEGLIDKFIQLLMGRGKTSNISLINKILKKLMEKKERKSPLYNVSTVPLSKTHFPYIAEQMGHVYRSRVIQLPFSRNSLLDKNALELILSLLSDGKTTVQLTPEGLKSLELTFIERLCKLEKIEEIESTKEEEIDLFSEVLSCEEEGTILFDELHKIGGKNELRYPFGDPIPIEPKYYRIIEKCMAPIAKDETLLTIIRSKDLTKLSKEDFDDLFRLPIAESMCKYFKVEEEKQKNELITYLTKKDSSYYSWIVEREDYDLISTARGVIAVLLPMTFSRKLNQHFGKSDKKEREYAIPFDGNGYSAEARSISNPYETALKTLLMVLKTGLSHEQSRMLFHFFLKKINEEENLRNVDTSETMAYKLLKKWFPDLKSEWDFKQRLALHGEAILLYARHFISKKITHYPENLCARYHDLITRFGTRIGLSGTGYNLELLGPLKLQSESGVTGEALNILKKRCPEDGIRILKGKNPKEILLEILETYFSKDKEIKFSSISDSDGELTGLLNEEVVQLMAEHLRQHRPDLKAISYFKRKKKGDDIKEEGDDIMWSWNIEAGMSILREECRIPPHQRVIYYDDIHCEGVDEKTTGSTVSIVGKGPLFKRLQADFRTRAFLRMKRLLGIGDKKLTIEELEKQNLSQQIHFVMTEEVKTLISGEETPTFEDIMSFVSHEEKLLLREDTYPSYCDQLKAAVRRAVMNKIHRTKGVKGKLGILKEFKTLLVKRVEIDPRKLFGPVEVQKETKEALKMQKDLAFNIVDKSEIFSEEEKGKVKNQLDAIPIPKILPKTVSLYTDGKDLLQEIFDDIGQEVCHEETEENEQKNENQQQIENELQTQTSEQKAKILDYKEWSWPKEVDFFSLECDLETKTFFVSRFGFFGGMVPKEQSVPPLFSCRKLMEEDMRGSINGIAKAFDERLWVSNNFLPRMMKNGEETSVSLCSSEQRPLFEVLVVARMDENGKMGIVSITALSQQDGKELRKIIPKANKFSPEKVFIYCMENEVAVAGNPLEFEFLKHDEEFQKLILPLKFLNKETDYSHPKLLKQWIKDNDRKKMKAAFELIHGGSFVGTEISIAFMDENKNVEDLI